jgi:hypothetical protein
MPQQWFDSLSAVGRVRGQMLVPTSAYSSATSKLCCCCAADAVIRLTATAAAWTRQIAFCTLQQADLQTGLQAHRVLKLLVCAKQVRNLSLERCCPCVARGHAGEHWSASSICSCVPGCPTLQLSLLQSDASLHLKNGPQSLTFWSDLIACMVTSVHSSLQIPSNTVYVLKLTYWHAEHAPAGVLSSRW